MCTDKKFERCLRMIPRTLAQRMYLKHLMSERPIVVGTGPPGCGKTMFACQAAYESLRSKHVSRIIVTRPLVAADEELGFLPGKFEEKMQPWTRPMFDLFENYMTKDRIQKVVEVAPLAYMRGRTFSESFIIADEMQNSTPSQMKMCLTRIGEQSRMVVTGDLDQSDLRGPNGLRDFLDRLEPCEYIEHVHMTSEDVQRHPVVRHLIERVYV